MLDVQEQMRRQITKSREINAFIFTQNGLKMRGVKSIFGCEAFSDVTKFCAAGMQTANIDSVTQPGVHTVGGAGQEGDSGQPSSEQ